MKNYAYIFYKAVFLFKTKQINTSEMMAKINIDQYTPQSMMTQRQKYIFKIVLNFRETTYITSLFLRGPSNGLNGRDPVAAW